MKIRMIQLFTLIGMLSLTSAYARDSYAPSFEDTSEFLSDPPEVVITPAEVWAYAFELIRPDGTSVVLSSDKTTQLVKPASTLKLFTGWWAFKENYRTNTYLSKMLSESVNDMADATVEEMGGLGAMDDYFRAQDIPFDLTNFRPVDGSGLDYANRSNCDIQMKLLKKIQKDEGYNQFKKFLAQPKKNGTLETRLTSLKGKIFAKTGTLNKTAALSGFAETPKGTMVFCILSDYLKVDLTRARKKIDNMVKVNYNWASKK